MTFSRISFKMIILEPVNNLHLNFINLNFNSEITVWVPLAQEYREVSSA